MKFKYLGLSILLSILWGAPAQSKEASLCDQALTQPRYLLEVGEAAAVAKKKICSTDSKIEKDHAYFEFLVSIKGWFDPYGGFEGGRSVLYTIESQNLMKSTFVSISSNLNDEIVVGEETFKPNDDSKCILVSHAANCSDVTNEFVSLFTEIHKLQVDVEILETIINLQKLRADWDPFLEHMKGQTWLELWVNQRAYKNTSDTFSGPPSSQWIVLHPTILLENVSAASDGDNIREALGIEIIGMNWWKQEKWYVPSGISALAVYSDRAEIEDVGYGLALHFQSNYTIGYTNHDGENGFYVSVDVVKLFQDKRKVFESYRSAFK